MPSSQLNGDAPQTALLLTQEEWDDLEEIAKGFQDSTRWVVGEAEGHGYIDIMRRRRALASRLIEANH